MADVIELQPEPVELPQFAPPPVAAPQEAQPSAPVPIGADSIVMGTGLGALFDRSIPKLLERGARGPDEVLGPSNVLARAHRKAFDSVEFDDIPDLSAGERDRFVNENADRYKQSALTQATEAVDEQEAADEPLRKAATSRLLELVPEAAPAHTDVGAVLAKSLDTADTALRGAGLGELADEIGDHLEPFDRAVALRESGNETPVSPARVFEAADSAYRLLRSRAEELPPEASDAMRQLRSETERPELFGKAAESVRALRSGDDLVQGTGIRDRDSLMTRLQGALVDQDSESRQVLQNYLDAQQERIDAYEGAGISTEGLSKAVDALEEALARGDRLTVETRQSGLRRAGKDSVDGDGPIRDVLAQAISESGIAATPDTLLRSMPETVARDFGSAQKQYRYDTTLRAIQEAGNLSLKKTARAMVGIGAGARGKATTADAANEAFTAGYPDEHAAFEARRSVLTRLQNDPRAMVDALSRNYGELASTHPDVFQGIVMAATRATAVLSEAMPASLEVSLQHPSGMPPSVDDIRRWSRTYMAVIEPQTFKDDLASGQAWPEQANAFAAAYPEEWAKLSKEAMTAAQIRGPALTPQQATYLDLTFNVGEQLGGMYSEKGAASIANANKMKAEKQKQQSQGAQKQAGPTAVPLATAALSQGPSVTPVG